MTAHHGMPLADTFGENAKFQEPHPFTHISATWPLLDPHGSLLATATRGPRKRAKLFSELRWWLPEIFATVLSVASLIALIVLVWNYRGRSLDKLHLPASLTLNGLVAILSTINRAALMVPVGSVLSQEVWLWLSGSSNRSAHQLGRLRDLETSDNASRGAWGSLIFLLNPKKRLATL